MSMVLQPRMHRQTGGELNWRSKSLRPFGTIRQDVESANLHSVLIGGNLNKNMITLQAEPNCKSARGEPTWEITTLFPRQGDWSESAYLALGTNHFVELCDGCLDFLPLPDVLHQTVVREMYRPLSRFVEHHKLGQVFFGSLPIRLGIGHFRTPDILYLQSHRVQKLREIGFDGQPDGADLVVEVVSPGEPNRHRDLVDKREIYARAVIPEYWIVDVEKSLITVLALDGDAYCVHGEFSGMATATSALLDGFAIAVSDIFAADEIH